MHVSATHKNARVSPRKVRGLANMLKGMSVTEAEAQLNFAASRKVRDLLQQVLKSAVANATHNNEAKAADLTVFDITVNKGIVLKRYTPRARGSAYPILKRASHITVTVAAVTEKKEKSKKKKTDIATITAGQYAAQPSLPSEEAPAGKAEAPVEPDARDKEMDVHGEMRSIQQGGNKKKSFRRKSI